MTLAEDGANNRLPAQAAHCRACGCRRTRRGRCGALRALGLGRPYTPRRGRCCRARARARPGVCVNSVLVGRELAHDAGRRNETVAYGVDAMLWIDLEGLHFRRAVAPAAVPWNTRDARPAATRALETFSYGDGWIALGRDPPETAATRGGFLFGLLGLLGRATRSTGPARGSWAQFRALLRGELAPAYAKPGSVRDAVGDFRAAAGFHQVDRRTDDAHCRFNTFFARTAALRAELDRRRDALGQARRYAAVHVRSAFGENPLYVRGPLTERLGGSRRCTSASRTSAGPRTPPRASDRRRAWRRRPCSWPRTRPRSSGPARDSAPASSPCRPRTRTAAATRTSPAPRWNSTPSSRFSPRRRRGSPPATRASRSWPRKYRASVPTARARGRRTASWNRASPSTRGSRPAPGRAAPAPTDSTTTAPRRPTGAAPRSRSPGGSRARSRPRTSRAASARASAPAARRPPTSSRTTGSARTCTSGPTRSSGRTSAT